MSDRFKIFLQKVRCIVESGEIHVQTVAHEAPPIAVHYTVGLTPRLGYELITMGIPPRLLGDAAKRLLSAPDIADEADIAGIASVPLRLRTLPLVDAAAGIDRRELIAIARALGFEPDRLRQLVWPDANGVFPPSLAYDHPIVQDVDQFLRSAPPAAH